MIKGYRFGQFQLDVEEETLYKNYEKAHINRRTFQVLKLLVERSGEIVSKQEFFDTVWKNAFVQDNSLTVTMTTLRKILGDDAKNPMFIENLPRKGYRFLADVESIEPEIQPKNQFKNNQNSPRTSDKTLNKSTNRKPASVLLVIGIVGIILGAGIFYRFYKNQKFTFWGNQSEIISIAVLPFENKNPETEYISDGLADSLISNLSQLDRMSVINRFSAFQYKNKKKDLAEIARELKVQAVLTGRMVERADEFLVTTELIDLRDGKQIWGKMYSLNKKDIYPFQIEITQDLNEVLRPKSSKQSKERIAKRQTDNAEAYRLYLKGRYFWNKRSGEDFRKAVDLFKEAIEADPTFAMAYVGLADTYAMASLPYLSNQADRVKFVRGALKKAREIDENLPEVYASSGLNKWFHEWDWKGAEKDFKRAIELNPNYSSAYHWLAELLALQGHFNESLDYYNKAQSLDPLSLAIKTDIGLTYFFSRQNERALKHFLKLKEIQPDYHRTSEYLIDVYLEMGMYQEAIEELKSISKQKPSDSDYIIKKASSLEKAFQERGEKGFWQERIKLHNDPKSLNDFRIAMSYSKLGKPDKAFESLEKVYADRIPNLNYLKARPEFDNIRSDPRFAKMLRRLGL